MSSIIYIRHTTSPVLWKEQNGEVGERNMLKMEVVNENQIAANVIDKFLSEFLCLPNINDVYNFIEENRGEK